MSHGHTHDANTPADHTHGPTPAQIQQMQQQQMTRPVPDPLLQAAIEADFKAVPLTLADADKPRSTTVCSAHSLETCNTCNLDFSALNALAKMFSLAPTDAILPPPNVVQPGRAQAVSKTKDEGNALYKRGMHVQAINAYTTAMQISSSRPPWEASALAKEELALVVCNRSAAFYAAGDPLSSLIDAEVVISLKRPWSKGHYRKGRALLKLGDVQGARDAVMLGLQFEPTNSDLEAFLKEVDDAQEKLDDMPVPTKAET